MNRNFTRLSAISDGQGTDDVSKSDAEVLPFTHAEQDEQQWALRDSNPRPQPCEGEVKPTSNQEDPESDP
jgi:hypothetical protein